SLFVCRKRIGSPYRPCTSFGGIVPLNVHTEFRFWVGSPGWNFSGIDCVGSIPEFKLEGTCGLYTVLAFAPSCVAVTAIFGGKSVNPWCAQIGPPGRPSIGPV